MYVVENVEVRLYNEILGLKGLFFVGMLFDYVCDKGYIRIY